MALGSTRNLRARLVVAVIVVAALMWLANQQTGAGEATRDVLGWLANAFDALVTFVLTVFN